MPKGNSIKPAENLKSEIPTEKYSQKQKGILIKDYRQLEKLRTENHIYLESIYRRIVSIRDNNRLKILILMKYKKELLYFIESGEIHILDVLEHLRSISFTEYRLGLHFDLKNTLEFALRFYRSNFNLDYLNRIGVLAYAFGFKDLSAFALFRDRILPEVVFEEISRIVENVKFDSNKENVKSVLNNLLEFIETTDMRADRLGLYFKIAKVFLKIKDFASLRKLYLRLYDFGLNFESKKIMLGTRYFLAAIKLQLEHVKSMNGRELIQNLEHVKEFLNKCKLNLNRYKANKVEDEDRRMDLIHLKSLIKEYDSIIASNSDNSTLEPFSTFRNSTEELN